MLEHGLFGSTPAWRRRRLRPMVLAVFSYRYDAELVPDLLANIEPMVDGWIAYDDRQAGELVSSEPRRRRILIERAIELGASWVLALDPDERVEYGAATRLRGMTRERQRIVWEFNLREMFSDSSYRVDGIWGSKMQGRLFPVFDGPLCSDQPLHGAWCVAAAGYSIVPAGLNLYHLKMSTYARRRARRDLYQHLDPDNVYQKSGYDYLIDENGAVFEQIPPDRDFFPAHGETGALHMADVSCRPESTTAVATAKACGVSRGSTGRQDPAASVSQLGQLRISIGNKVRRDSKLAVVVIGLSAPKSLFNAVHSLMQQDMPSEIIVVNSGGGDISHILGEYAEFVVLVELRRRVHVGEARNMGIQVSRAPFVAFLAGDCVAAPGWVAERTYAHMECEYAVASVVENDKPHNPFACASHLMTYGHRIAGVAGSELALYGASYDRTLFDKYGYFSEAMVIGEDSEFHNRFRDSDPIWLRTSIRTIHCNPGGPISFLRDQFSRGLRRRYLADFFDLDFTLGYIALATVRRVVRPLRLSLTRLQGKERLASIVSWPLLPIGALVFSWGMIVSYFKSKIADHLFCQANKMAMLRQPMAAVGLLRRAIDLRPVTTRYHFALATLLKEIGQYGSSERELYATWDIDKSSMIHVASGNDRIVPEDLKQKPPVARPFLQVVVFSESSDMELAEFLRSVSAQRLPSAEVEVYVVEARDGRFSSESMNQLRLAYAHIARFVSCRELFDILSIDNERDTTPTRSFVVASSSSCVPSEDWLATLRAYIITYPEVDLFHGSCRPQANRRAGLIERMSFELGLFPRTAERDGILYFGRAANWACDKFLLLRSGGLTSDQTQALGAWTLTERAMKAGASSMYARDWHIRFRMDSTLSGVLQRFYQDGYYGAMHVAVTNDRDVPSRFFPVSSLTGAAVAAWRSTVDNLRIWRFRERSFLLHVPALFLLFSAGLARQIGWLKGLKRYRIEA